MLAYATVGAVNMAASIDFYDAVMGALGASRFYTDEAIAGYRTAEGEPALWVCHPFDKQSARAGNGIMVGFKARSRAAIDEFHAAALANGGSCEGKPGLREHYGPDIYIAYVRDPVGNKISAICDLPA